MIAWFVSLGEKNQATVSLNCLSDNGRFPLCGGDLDARELRGDLQAQELRPQQKVQLPTIHPMSAIARVLGDLAHKKQRPPRTLQ